MHCSYLISNYFAVPDLQFIGTCCSRFGICRCLPAGGVLPRVRRDYQFGLAFVTALQSASAGGGLLCLNKLCNGWEMMRRPSP